MTNDPRFSRAEVIGRHVTRLAPHFIPQPSAMDFADPPDHTRLRRAVAPRLHRAAVWSGCASRPADARRMVDAMLRDGPPADLIERLLEPFRSPSSAS